VLCDFSLTVGDTFVNTVPSLVLPTTFVIVQDTFITTLEGSRRILHTDYPGISWIESVGSTAGPFYLMELAWDMYDVTNCLERDGVAAYGPIYPTCDIFMTSAPDGELNEWDVTVSSTQEGVWELQIAPALALPVKVELFDLQGRCLRSQTHSPASELSLNTGPLASGIYLLTVSQGAHTVCLKMTNP
jgi:hypothetical protein